ncbi:MAG: hypothetical protein ACOY90_06805 [Candidatus Zhuqueibacterota bacterium]
MKGNAGKLVEFILRPALCQGWLMIFSVMMLITQSAAQDAGKDSAATAPLSVAENDSDIVLSDLEFHVQEILSEECWGRNPFLPYANLQAAHVSRLNPVQAGVNDKVFVLEKIHWNRGGRSAIINHKKLATGDALNDYTVVYIGEAVVILQLKDDYVVLSLNE